MRTFNPQGFQRRQFLQTLATLATSAAGAMLAQADDVPKNTNPRAIFGDFRDNDIRRSGEAGIHFRGGNRAFAPHRNRIEGNRIVDSGGEKGIGIEINGETEAVVLSKNEIRETRGRASRIGILIGAQTRDIRNEDNRIDGFATPLSDLRRR
jgi:hypothetical protein